MEVVCDSITTEVLKVCPFIYFYVCTPQGGALFSYSFSFHFMLHFFTVLLILEQGFLLRMQFKVAVRYTFIVDIGLASQGCCPIVSDISPDYRENKFRELYSRLKLKKICCQAGICTVDLPKQQLTL